MARVLVVGAGGVGGYFGAALASGGHDVAFVARGANLEALRDHGLRVTGTRTIELPKVNATDDASRTGERDLVLLCVKAYDLDDAARAASSCGGIALTLQNGVDAAARAAAILGPRVLAGTTGIVADLVEPGHVDVVSSYTRIRFGEPDAGDSDRVGLVRSWLEQAGPGLIEVEALSDVRIALWEKMALICGMAGLTTLYRSPIGPILADPFGRETFRRVVDECAAVARASGVALAEDFSNKREVYADTIEPDATSSMLRDLERGKRVEIEHLNGAIVRLGAGLGVPVPLNEAIYAGVRVAAT